jgi:hypothetical protein
MSNPTPQPGKETKGNDSLDAPTEEIEQKGSSPAPTKRQ